MTDREACITLNMISGVGYAKYRALCDAFGRPPPRWKSPRAIC